MNIKGIATTLGFLALIPATGWLAFAKPVPAISGFAGGLFIALLVALLIIALLIYGILNALPTHPRVAITSDESITADSRWQLEDLEQQGFARIIGPVLVNTGPPTIMLPTLSADTTTIGAVYFPVTHPEKIGTDLVSILRRPDGEKVFLTTGNLAAGGSMPPPRGSFMQLFTDADARTLLQEHRDALRYLGGYRYQAIPASEKQFGPAIRNYLKACRQRFLGNPIGLTVPALWTTVTGHSARLGPISNQSAAIRHLSSR